MTAARNPKVLPVESLTDWFRESIESAMRNQRVETIDGTSQYMVNLLTVFARSDRLYQATPDGYQLPPLAFLYADAVESSDARERELALQRLGDVALFIAGFFADSLARKLVDVDYYSRMGGAAYGTLADQPVATQRARALVDVFRELAAKFTAFVDVLAEVADAARVFTEADILRLYEIWMKTGSQRAEKLLRSLGIEPSRQATTEFVQ
ncbi:MAG: hypothetical protein PVJ40_06505 [Gammaproteobacteria bacterium]|jgi:hypothetical protein